MPRIAGVNIPEKKRIEHALTYIYGIGLTRSQKVLKEASIDPNTRAHKLTDAELNTLRSLIEKNFSVEGVLRREKMLHVKRLKQINSYRGSRHSKKLPARGQRTKTNSRTVRGNVRKTAGSGKKPPAQKT